MNERLLVDECDRIFLVNSTIVNGQVFSAMGYFEPGLPEGVMLRNESKEPVGQVLFSESFRDSIHTAACELNTVFDFILLGDM